MEGNIKSYKPFTEGSGIAFTYPRWVRIIKLVKQLLKTKKTVFASIDGFLANFLPLMHKKFIVNGGNSSFVILGHPKAISDQSISCLEEFLKDTVTHYQYKVIEDYL